MCLPAPHDLVHVLQASHSVQPDFQKNISKVSSFKDHLILLNFETYKLKENTRGAADKTI